MTFVKRTTDEIRSALSKNTAPAFYLNPALQGEFSSNLNSVTIDKSSEDEMAEFLGLLRQTGQYELCILYGLSWYERFCGQDNVDYSHNRGHGLVWFGSAILFGRCSFGRELNAYG